MERTERGTFYTAFKGDYIIAYAVIALAVVAELAIISFSANPLREWLYTGGALFFAIVGGLIFVVLTALMLGVCIVINRIVMGGFKCEYEADSEKLTLVIKGKRTVIYYADVDVLMIEPISYLRRIRGYDVTVRVNGFMQEYKLAFGQNKSVPRKSSTPFEHIRVYLDTKSFLHAEETQYSSPASPENPAVMPMAGDGGMPSTLFPEKPDPVIFSEDGGMPSIGVPQKPQAVPLQKAPAAPTKSYAVEAPAKTASALDRLEALLSDEQEAPAAPPKSDTHDVQPNTTGLEPIARLSTDEMPAVGSALDRLETALSEQEKKKPAVEPLSPISPADPPAFETDRTALRIQGEMECLTKYVPFMCVAAAAIAALGALETTMVISVIFGDNPFDAYIFVFAAIVWGLLLVGGIRTITRGRAYRYSANNISMKINGKKGIDAEIYYSDVIGVDYIPFRFLGMRGYRVRVLTKYRDHCYDYLIPNKLKVYPTEKTPFHFIEENAPYYKKENLSRTVDRAEEERFRAAQGFFRSTAKNEKKLIAVTAVVVCVMLPILFFAINSAVQSLFYSLAGVLFNSVLGYLLTGVSAALALLIDAVIVINAANMVQTGCSYHYYRDQTTLTITDDKCERTELPLSDITSVTHRALRFLWLKRGYKVRITSSRGEYSFNILCGKSKSFEELPIAKVLAADVNSAR